MNRLVLAERHWERMRSDVEACLPHEACGLLAGKADEVLEVLPIANQERSATRFRMDPVEQIRAFTWIETQGLDLVGIYHSHTAGPESGSPANPGPSATDVADAAYPVAYIVWSRPEGVWQARAYWIEGGRVSEVELHLVPAGK